MTPFPEIFEVNMTWDDGRPMTLTFTHAEAERLLEDLRDPFREDELGEALLSLRDQLAEFLLDDPQTGEER